MLRRSTAKNTPITAVERTSRGIRNEQAPPVSCARRSRYEETRKNGEIVEGEKHLTHQERGPLRVDAVEKVRQVVSNVELADVRAQVGLSLFTDFENFTTFKPGPHLEPTVTGMLDQVIAWGGALKPLRTPKSD
jgi:hypothetical protein